MIPSFLALASVFFISPSWGALSRAEFEMFIEPMCFNVDESSGEPFINGQENPLSQTLENFIAMAEKFEVANPNLGLKEELFYFIRNYTYDNFEYSALGDVVKWNPKDSQFDIVDTLWEPDENQRKRLPEGEDPFTDAEKCSIFHMISHSIILTPRKVNQQRSSTNNTRKSFGRLFDLEAQYPMEVGVVAIRGTEVAVALGKVLTGMYVGLNENRKKSIDQFNERIPKQEGTGQNQVVDYLYTLTLAEVIALATWRPESGNREKLAIDGSWVSAPIGADLDTNAVCPMIYRLKDGTMSAYSHSSMRGAADGFILGRVVGEIQRRNRNTKLSQILRMYYSRGGLSERDEEMGQVWASFCNRQNFLNPLEQTLKEQLYLYELLVSTSYKNVQGNTDYAWNYYTTEKSSIFGLWNQELNDHCRKELTVDKAEDLPLETPLDVIAVLDTSDGEENLKKQQLILGYVAKELDLRYSGSQMTVLTDQKVAVTASGKVVLNSIVTEAHSSSCVACYVTQFVSDGTPSAPEDDVIIAIDQLIQAKKENETRYSGVNGKVIIYFNFNEDTISGRPSQLQIRVDKALRDLHVRHIDVAMYALGRAPDLVKKYARNDLAFVMSAVDETEDIVGKKLFHKISTAAATLQYHNCADGKNENGAVYEDFVSPNAVQHWGMPARYFYKSRNLKVSFEAQYGPIRVCHGRATVSPELQKTSCHDVPSGQKIEFKHSNPCISMNEVSCSPFYFSVLGVNSTDTTRQDYCVDTNTENQCRTLDQIKFKVSHDGIRCSGSVGLIATPIVLLLGVLLLNIISRKF